MQGLSSKSKTDSTIDGQIERGEEQVCWHEICWVCFVNMPSVLFHHFIAETKHKYILHKKLFGTTGTNVSLVGVVSV